MSEIRILSIDAGGMYGILSLAMLAHLEKKLKAPLLDHFHLSAGSSTGSIILAGLSKTANGTLYSADEIRALYIEQGPKIFETTTSRTLRSGNGYMSPLFNNQNRQAVFDKAFGDTRLSDLTNDILIPAQKLDSAEPYYFKSWKARKDAEGADNFYVKDTIIAATSAPGYFEIPKITNMKGEGHYLMDGATYTHNPALRAHSTARNLYHHSHKPLIVSFGLSNPKSLDPFAVKSDGKLEWASRIYPFAAQGQSAAVNHDLSEDPHVNYVRFEANLKNIGVLNQHISADFANASKAQIRQLQAAAVIISKQNSYILDQMAEYLQTPMVSKNALRVPEIGYHAKGAFNRVTTGIKSIASWFGRVATDSKPVTHPLPPPVPQVALVERTI
jgi:patatin-like phospholipase/acyl hydrolase